jgi:predicted deacylase
MWTGLVVVAALAYLALWLRALLVGDLADSAYPSPEEAEAELDSLADSHPELCQLEVIGKSSQGRPLHALRLCAQAAEDHEEGERPRLLVTAQIHAVEFVGSFLARAVARRLVEGYGRDQEITALLDRAEVWIAPLLNPDGARRVWERRGWVGLGGSRFTATGVDPNRNFPFRRIPGRSGWNSARKRPGSAYYRGPHPLSEPECRALAGLCQRQRFCGALNFHSFGGVVYMPSLSESTDARARFALDVFQGEFQSRQPHLRYRPRPERPAAITGQLDSFALAAFGTPSVTVEVSRPGFALLRPSRLGNLFWVANPERPEHWVENDRDAAIHALVALLERTEGRPCTASSPELVDALPGLESGS